LMFNLVPLGGTRLGTPGLDLDGVMPDIMSKKAVDVLRR